MDSRRVLLLLREGIPGVAWRASTVGGSRKMSRTGLWAGEHERELLPTQNRVRIAAVVFMYFKKEEDG